ncbi:MAG: zf-HC2 domain-containing protein [candidate division NC10 bacterium]|nr:zf-HC2 domain-containing protein [candidate division NC10 bacterium]
MEALKCKDVIVEFLADYLDRTLPPELTEEVERHLRGCAACMAYLNTYRRTRDLVGRHAAQGGMPDEMKGLLRRFMVERMARQAP